MSALFDLSSNYSIFSIPAAWLLAMWPSTYGKVKGRKILDPANPRDFVESIKKSDQIDKTIRNRLIRSQAAALNGFEGLPMFIGAVLAANIAGLSAKTVNLLAASYLFSRVVYNVTFILTQAACAPTGSYFMDITTNQDADFCQPAISKIDIFVRVVLNVVTDLYLFTIPIPMLWQ
ncbi:uncharacterized protein PG998_014997 [Apiospora kogelbergensis]|uniref:uncharacterized protein n=1 Tax=Apiospora kogelbergensis TaxID=1337665 RepID=UPI003130E741